MTVREMPFFSVVIPVHNAEKYLQCCVESIVTQEYPGYEIILVENNSSDGSYAECVRLAEKYEAVTLVRTREKGVSKARNLGLQRAKGDYVTFCDADDYYEAGIFSEVAEELLQRECTLLVFGMNVVDEKQSLQRKRLLQDSAFWGKQEYLERTLCDNDIMGSCCNRFYQRAVVGGLRFPTDLFLSEDTYFNCLVADGTPEDAVFRYLNVAGYNYRQSPESATNSSERLFDGARLGYLEALDKIGRDVKLSLRLKIKIRVKKMELIVYNLLPFPEGTDAGLYKKRVRSMKKDVWKNFLFYLFYPGGSMVAKAKQIVKLLLL